jgi:hypothetical protein
MSSGYILMKDQNNERIISKIQASHVYATSAIMNKSRFVWSKNVHAVLQ